MRLHRFRGTDPQRVFEAARVALGDDVMVVRTDVRREGGVSVMEIVATTPDEVEVFQRRLEPDPLPLTGRRARRGSARPLTLALVGPTGAGKTTTIAKLAAHPKAFGGRSVGLLTLDTYRVGALEQLTIFADLAGLPVEVVYGPGEGAEALRRLSHCDVVLVDTPGRSPRAEALNEEWSALLREVRPDEVHLVLPAVLRPDIAEAVRDSFVGVGVSHLLLTKLDEVPGETGVADLAGAMDLPARWVTDGQEIPTDLRPGAQRIVSSLGVSSSGPPKPRSAA